MKSWVKNKRLQAGFIERGFLSCTVCPAGVVLHKEFVPPAISCGDAQGAEGNSLFTAQDLPHLCPREIKKQMTVLEKKTKRKKQVIAQREQSRQIRSLSCTYK